MRTIKVFLTIIDQINYCINTFVYTMVKLDVV